MKDAVCAHVCTDLELKQCKKVTVGDVKVCKALKIKNPCKECMPKDCGN